MTEDSFYSFCGNSSFWNESYYFYKDWPQMTPCFMNTTVVWIPCGWLWLSLPCYLYCLFRNGKSHTQIAMNALNASKLTVCVLLCILTAVILFTEVTNLELHIDEIAPIQILNTSLYLASFLLTGILSQLERIKGFITSSVQFVFWLLLAFTNIVPFYTKIISQTYTEDIYGFVAFYIFYFLVILQLVLFCWAEKRDPSTAKEYDEDICPEMNSSFINRLYFGWMSSIVVNAYKKPLEEHDVWSLGIANKSKTIVPMFERKWNKSIAKAKKNIAKQVRYNSSKYSRKYGSYDEKSPLISSDITVVNGASIKTDLTVHESEKEQYDISLCWVLAQTFGLDYMTSLFYKFISDVLQFASPILVGVLINYADAQSELPIWRGYVPAILLFLTTIVQSVCCQQNYHIGMTVGMRIKSTLIAAIYKKSLTLRPSAKKSTTLGEIVNLMSVDCQRIQDTFLYAWALMSCPLQLCIAVILLWDVLGPACLAGLVVLLMMVPINSFVVVQQRKLQEKILRLKGKRIKLMNEILNGMKVLKMYAWELPFKAKVKEIRDKELHFLTRIAFLLGGTEFCWILASFMVTLATFAIYVLTSDEHFIDASKAFVALAIFNILSLPINMFSQALSRITQAYVSIKRIEQFLKGQDLNPDNVQRRSNSDYAVEVSDGVFTWDPSLPTPTLRGIDLEVNEGQLIAVVGQVGCGKSSLISALLGEMDKLNGRVNIRGNVAYVPQEAWIQNATLRDNILFGKGYIRKKYNKVVNACSLTPDLEILPGGDLIEIGEKGINISGGQKQRVSLARAVYSNSDIYLMDDPLSAVDAHVGKHIFENVIGSNGLLKNKTRILVTHGVHWLPMVDTVVVMVNGKLSEIGSYEELVSHDGVFAQFLKQYFMQEEPSDVEDPVEIRQIKQKMIEQVEYITSEGITSTDGEGPKKLTESRKRTISTASSKHERQGKSLQNEILVTEEFSEQGEIKWSVFGDYAKGVGILASVIVLLLFTGYNVASVCANFWLTFWTEDEYLLNNKNISTTTEYISRSYHYLAIFGFLGIVQVVLVLFYAILMMVRMVVATGRMHNKMMERILEAPMEFFDTTPIGRIINRFTTDIDLMDNALPMTVRITLHYAFLAVSTWIVITINTPLFVSVLLPVAVLYYFLMKFYIPTARQLKRIESVTRSPMFNHFSETVTGASVIRAFGVTERFFAESMKRVDKHLMYYYANIASTRWLGVRTEILGNLLVLAASLFSIFSAEDGGIIGLSVTYALQVSALFNFLITTFIELANNIVCVERIKEYSEIDKEAEWYTQTRPPVNWPVTGHIKFLGFKTRYREGLDLVLKGINCEIKHGEMIGIVGRTGAGKSSLTLSLFRLVEAASGCIIVDGIRIAEIGLHDLRNSLTILPQDPFLFSGSVRMNLDPFNQYTDDEIWLALESAHLKDFILDMPSQLYYECGEGGSNLSVGQRQLVCLARTLLKKTKILILDEATAAVDFQTDDLIQQTIRTEFRDCTVLTIAHRLNTILDYDRVLVLDEGQIIEFDSPAKLLESKTSVFYGMAKDAGFTYDLMNRRH